MPSTGSTPRWAQCLGFPGVADQAANHSACVDEFNGDGAADISGRAGQEHAHVCIPYSGRCHAKCPTSSKVNLGLRGNSESGLP